MSMIILYYKSVLIVGRKMQGRFGSDLAGLLEKNEDSSSGFLMINFFRQLKTELNQERP